MGEQLPDIRRGDFYEDCRYHPMLCVELRDGDELVGISLVDGVMSSCSLGFCGVEKLTLDEALERRADIANPS